MLRRSTAFFTGRESIFIVKETRGLPFTAVTLIIAFFFFMAAIRDIFFCGHAYPWEDNIHTLNYFEAVYSDCRSNKFVKLTSMFSGGYTMLMAMIRLQVAASVDTAVLYSSMQLLVCSDILLALILLRFDFSAVPLFYQFLLAIFTGFEIYLLLVARTAYIKRKGEKDFRKFIKEASKDD